MPSARHNAYRDGRVHVCRQMCATCVFRPGNLMDYRARGRCSCGVEFNPERNPDGSRSHSDTMDRADVIEAWKDHVEEEFYALRDR